MTPEQRPLYIGIVFAIVAFGTIILLRSLIPGDANAGYRQAIGWFIFAMGWFPYFEALARRRGRTASARRHLVFHTMLALVSAAMMGVLASL
jgi:hypothetical protein